MTTVAEYKARFPEHASIAEDRVQLFLDDAARLMTSTDKWLEYYDVAQAYYAAHFLVVGEFQLAGDSGTQAPIKKQEVDDVVIESAIGTIDPSASELLSTSYGKRYVQYRAICLGGIRGF